MERRAKERLIGASILVILIVLIAPELLSGPAKKAQPAAPTSLPKPAGGTPEPSRSVTVDLNTSRSTASEPDSGVAEPAPAAGAADSAPIPEPAASVPPAVAPPTVAPSMAPPSPAAPPHVSVENAAQSPTSAGAWSVQLGSFANRANADKLVGQLKAQGYGAYVAPQGSGRSQRYRVRVGPAVDRPGAERLLARLKVQGHAGSIVSPGAK